MKRKSFLQLLAAFILLLSPLTMWAQQLKEAYAYSPSADRSKFYFYYDTQRSTRNTTGNTFNLNTPEAPSPAWYTFKVNGEFLTTMVKTVVFDESFKDCRPTTTAVWFRDMISLETIEKFYYLYTWSVRDMTGMFYNCKSLTEIDFRRMSDSTTNMTESYIFTTASVTSMREMFRSCTALTSLDLSGWDTRRVTDMYGMFQGCTNLQTLTLGRWDTSKVQNMDLMFGNCNKLQTIKVGFNWSTAAVNASNKPFTGCTSLVGGAGTAFSETYNSPTYARVDQGSTAQGLLTANYGPYAYRAKLNNSGDYSLTFYYDELRDTRTGGPLYTYEAYDLNSPGQTPGWYYSSDENPFVKVVFDSSFALACPTTCNNWFYEMRNLTTIEGLEYLNTSEVTNMRSMFYGCKSLESIDLSHFNTSKVTNMEFMFDSCDKLTSLDLSQFNTSNVTSMYGMFDGCDKLTELDLTTFNTSKVKDMANMFFDCSSLTTIYVSSNFSVSNTTSSARMFLYCTSLVGEMGTKFSGLYTDKTYARIDGGTASPGYFCAGKPYALISDGQKTLTFYYDTKMSERGGMSVGPFVLDEYDQPNSWGKTYDITKVVFDSSFANCKSLTSTAYWFSSLWNLATIEGIENLKTNNVTDMKRMFSSCASLTELDVSGFNTAKVTDMSYMFNGCSGLTSLDVSNFSTAKVTDMSGMFRNCFALTSIYCDKDWNKEGLTSTDMFFGCSNLKGGIGTAYNSSNVTATYARPDATDKPGYFSIRPYAVLSTDGKTLTFYFDNKRSSRSGTKYNLNSGNDNPGWYTDGKYANVTNVVFNSSFENARPTSTRYWFYEMKNLISIQGMKEYLNTSEVTNMNRMFYYCSSLTSLDVSGFNTENVTNMSGMFNYCSILESIDVSGFNTEKVTTMTWMFRNCSALTTIYCDKNWSKTGLISTDMFYGCTSLKGGNGTTFNSSNVTAIYAHPDGGTDNPGYFTKREAYAALSLDGKTLTFLYGNRSPRGTTYDLKSDETYPDWYSTSSIRTNITSVVFDSSFKDARPTSTFGWFYGMSNLTSISGIEYLNTSEVTTMRQMFRGCSKLESIDVSGFNTEKVTNMSYMFNGCSSLTTIICNSDWKDVTNSSSMFYGCTSLVGGNGTTYDADNTNGTYAHPDAAGNPGYFTKFVLGDANGDGKVTITDAVAVVNYILGSTQGTFNVTAADVSGDGTITITDAVGIVNIILNSNSAGVKERRVREEIGMEKDPD